MEKYSKKGRTEKFSYGYRRFSLLAAFINSIILITGSVFILSKAIPRLLNPETSNYVGMILLAILGIIVNGAAVLKLKKGKSLSEKIVSWHLLEDVLGWVAVLIVSIINMFIDLPVLDPLLAIIFTLIIVYGVFKNLKQIVAIFLQSTPGSIDVKKLEKKIKSIKGVLSVHDTHVWTMDNENHILTIHVVVKDKTSLSKIRNIKCKVKNMINSFNIQHATVEIEEKNEKCKYQNC